MRKISSKFEQINYFHVYYFFLKITFAKIQSK